MENVKNIIVRVRVENGVEMDRAKVIELLVNQAGKVFKSLLESNEDLYELFEEKDGDVVKYAMEVQVKDKTDIERLKACEQIASGLHILNWL